MKTRFFATAAIAVLLLNVTGLSAADTKSAKTKKLQLTRLVSLLPASDGVAVFDSKRFLNDALPKVLASNQPMLQEILAKISEMESRTGIDLRKFDQVAVGVAINQISPTNIDFEPVVIANGDINAGAMIAIARLASNGTYREEKIGSKTIYLFSPKAVLQKTTVKTTNSKIAGVIDKALNGLTKEVAVTALDPTTLVIGSLARVRATLDGTSRVGLDISSLISAKETAVMSFALKSPGGLSNLIPLDNDELGLNIDAIDYLFGSVDVAATGTSLNATARTKKTAQAQGLKDTLEGLQIVGGAVFGGSKRPDQKIYGRLIKSAKIANRGNDVSIELMVPQSDIDSLLAGVK